MAGAPAGKWNDFIAISNIYGGNDHFTLLSVALIEVVLTALFVVVIVCVTSDKAPSGFAPWAYADVYPSRRNPGLKRVGQSGALDGDGDFRRRRGLIVPLAVLGRAIVGGVVGGVIGRWLSED